MLESSALRQHPIYLLRRPLQGDNREVLSARMITDLQANGGAVLFRNGGLGRGTDGASRPSRSWLESGALIGRLHPVMDLSWGLPAKGGVRSAPVIPGGKERHLTAESLLPDWRQNHIHALALQASDESLDYCDASLLPYGAKARPNVLSPAPALETLAPELLAFVADQVLRLGTQPLYCSAQKRLQRSGRKAFLEYPNP